MTFAEIPVSESGETNNTRNIREEFSYFLSSCVKSSRTTNNSLGTYGSSAVGSYLSMLDKREDGTILLFDYNPEKWKHIQDVYQITNPTQAEEIYNQLLQDSEFVSRNFENNNNWRAGALNLYVLFLRARKYFSRVLTTSPIKTESITLPQSKAHLPYLTALRTKPFMLLAGISGTGKSRIVREMAKACWKEGDPEYGKNHPRNFCMVQVKPNWHDSSELIGYVSRLNGEKFVVGPFLRFLAAAIKEPEVPYFLCLDEMNLAPVEQYFAEYLSVIESRKLNPDGTITTDPIIEYENTDAYGSLIDQLFDTPEERKTYKTDEGGKRLTIPQNLFVVGTVNMDETTFSFSRKVLDRAMTIEMNEVDLHGGLERGVGNEIGYIGNSIIGDAAEGCDIYEEHRDLCDQVLAYLEQVNNILEGTPFKIAYRTRNEFLMYAVNRQTLAPESQLWQTLDEMTSMKILSRIEGDEERTKKVLDGLKTLVEEQIVSAIPPAEEGKPRPGVRADNKGISATKIDEMLSKLKATGFTSYWA
ncbi:MAG: AAA family ATPase [Bacteroidales bacterium]|nr:AAA family ATPase [Bacteroidales bacterium]